MNILLALLLAASAPETGAVSRASHAETPASLQSVHEVVVPATRPKVWAAIASAEGWRGWAATRAWVPPGEPQVIESSYDPNGAPGGAANIKSLVILKVPDRLLAFRTVKAPDGFKDAEALAAISWVIELETVPVGTRVRLTGSGYPRTPAGERILGFFMEHNPIALQALRDRFAAAGAAAATQQ